MNKPCKFDKITNWLICDEYVHSEYGKVSNHQWCMREMERIQELHPESYVAYKTYRGVKYCCIMRK